MSANASPARANQSHEAQAAHWAARTLGRALRPSEREERDAWLAADSLNQQAFERVMQAHEIAQDAASMPDIQAIRREALAAEPENPSSRWRWAMAACALFAIWLASFAALQSLRTTNEDVSSQIASAAPRDHYRTGIGERMTATLADGSTITLNTASEIRIHFSNAQRRIELVSGQVLFAVAHDAARHFLVQAGEQSVRALGTQFEVRRRGDALEVVLVEGVVAVGETRALENGDLSRAARMQAGERLITTTPASFEVAPANVEILTSWTSGRVIFSATRLDAAIAEINRYREHPLVIDDPEIAALEISGAYRVADAANFGQALAPTLAIQEEELADGRVRLVPATPGP